MSKEITRYKDCVNGRFKLVRDILELAEDLSKKYNINPEDYHKLRVLVRSRSFMFENLWLRHTAWLVDDKKFLEKVNEKGELDGDNWTD